MKKDDVIIIGAGWAGLSCAVSLCRAGKQVRILEAARQMGGRARKINFKTQTLDNGQHLLLGAYHNTLNLLETFNIPEENVFKRQALELDLYIEQGNNVCLKTPPLPAPLHLLTGLFTMQGLGISERLQAVKLSVLMTLNRFKLQQDISALEYLKKHQQSNKVISVLWEPLCLAALNTPIHTASMQIFMNVIKDSFSKRRHDSDILIPFPDLSAVFTDPAREYLQNNNAQLMTGTKAVALDTENMSVETMNGIFMSEQIVIATTPIAAAKLLQPLDACKNTCDMLLSFKYQPIFTIYLQYPEKTVLGKDVRGMVGTLGQWVFDRQLNQQKGLMAVVISGPGSHTEMNNDLLGKTIADELALMNPHWDKPVSITIIREKRATFDCSANTPRPDNKIPLKDIYLAGDYTDTGYPATLEGAVISGLQTAKDILDNNDL